MNFWIFRARQKRTWARVLPIRGGIFHDPDRRRVEMQSTLKVDNRRVRRPMKMQIVHPPPPPVTTRPWILFYGDWMSLKT